MHGGIAAGKKAARWRQRDPVPAAPLPPCYLYMGLAMAFIWDSTAMASFSLSHTIDMQPMRCP